MEKLATLTSLSPNSPSSSTNIQATIDSTDLEDDNSTLSPTDSDDNKLDYWKQPIDDELLAIADDVVCTLPPTIDQKSSIPSARLTEVCYN